MPIDRTRIEANGWSQGKFFRPEDSAKLFEQHAARVAGRTIAHPDTLILASHDCDILSCRLQRDNSSLLFPCTGHGLGTSK